MKITKEQWVAEGKKMFGDNMFLWKFKCPGCGHVQTPEDFRPFKEAGATPNSAYSECIGRYTGGKSWANDKQSKPGPCDYAGYGLFKISPVIVVDGANETHAFAFSPNEEAKR